MEAMVVVERKGELRSSSWKETQLKKVRIVSFVKNWKRF